QKERPERKRKAEGQRVHTNSSTSVARFIRFDPLKPSLYPNKLLKMSEQDAVEEIIANTSITRLQAMSRSCGSLHDLPGIKVPDWFQHLVALGRRFLFSSRYNHFVVESACERFVNLIRWKFYFENNPNPHR